MEALAYTPGMDCGKSVSFEEAVSHLDNPDALVWLDYEGLKPEEQKFLVSRFGFHELAMEDAAKPDGQRPKVEPFDDHFFLVMYSLSFARSGRSLSLHENEVDLFVGQNYVISVRRRQLPEVATVWKDAQARQRIMNSGSDRLAYYLLDAVVDHYVEAMDEAEDVLDELEDAVMDPAMGREVVGEIFGLKRELTHFRRMASSMRDAVNEMTSRAFPHVKEETLLYLRDIYDHLIRISDMLDSQRDMLTSALDVHLSAVSNRLNDIMKRLTVVATIFMPLTFISGFWGMNFEAMPFASTYWYWGSLVSMVAVVLWMMAYFWRKRWM